MSLQILTKTKNNLWNLNLFGQNYGTESATRRLFDELSDSRFSEVPKENISLDVKIAFANLIVITQSCDLENGKNELVAMCPIYPLAEFEEANPKATQKGFWEQVRRGKIEGFYLLSSFENPENNREC